MERVLVGNERHPGTVVRQSKQAACPDEKCLCVV